MRSGVPVRSTPHTKAEKCPIWLQKFSFQVGTFRGADSNAVFAAGFEAWSNPRSPPAAATRNPRREIITLFAASAETFGSENASLLRCGYRGRGGSFSRK